MFWTKVLYNISIHYFQPVALFIVEKEEASSIAEALFVIKQWQIHDRPSFIIDHSIPEMKAIEEVFPGTISFHHLLL